MSPQQWQRVKALFGAALEREPGARAAFLEQACGAEDAEILREVEALLAAHEGSDSFLETPAVALMPDASPEPSLLQEGQTIGRFRLLGLLGAGGMGQVYLAEDPRLRRRIALKLLPRSLSRDADRLRRFEQEARAASVLSHPNVCVIHEIGESGEGEEERHFIAMEHVPGESLRQRLERHRAAGTRMPLPEVLEIVQQAAAGLTAAHEAGIVHRDVKPENVMIRPDGLVKLLDFGLAKLADPSARASVLRDHRSGAQTEPGMVLGTVQYMSPEQARGLPVDHRTDLWSLGATLYEMLSGRAAFAGPTTTDVLVAVVDREPPPLEELAPEVPAAVQAIVARTLRKDREERYQSARELSAAVETLRRELDREAWHDARGVSGPEAQNPDLAAPVALPTTEVTLRGTRRSSRRSAAVLAAAVLAGLLVPSVLYLDLLGIGGTHQSVDERGIAAAVGVQEWLPQGDQGGSGQGPLDPVHQAEDRSGSGGPDADRRDDRPTPNEPRVPGPSPATPPAPGGSTPTPAPPVSSGAVPGPAAVDLSASLLQDSILLERQFRNLDAGLPRPRLEAIRDTTRLVWDRWNGSGTGASAGHRGRAAYLLGTVWNALDSPGQCVIWMERALALQPERANYRRMLEVCRSLLD